MLAAIVIAASVLVYLVSGSQISASIRWLLHGLIIFAGPWLSMAAVFRRRILIARGHSGPTIPYNAAAYKSVGLWPVSCVNATEMDIDLMKRCVANIFYKYQPTSFYDGERGAQAASEFNLHRRVAAQDIPTLAQTMIGMHRLDNIRNCFKDVLPKNVSGDFAETGSYRGGGTIFMRALLKAWGVTDRRVFVCDAFVPMEADLSPRLTSVSPNCCRYDNSSILRSFSRRVSRWIPSSLAASPR